MRSLLLGLGIAVLIRRLEHVCVRLPGRNHRGAAPVLFGGMIKKISSGVYLSLSLSERRKTVYHSSPS